MLPPKTAAAATALLAGLGMPAMAVANTLIVPFTLTVEAPATLSLAGFTGFTSTPFAQFDPANGTLTGIDISLSGHGLWGSHASQGLLETILTLPGDGSVTIGTGQSFAFTGVIDVSLTASYDGNLLSPVLRGSGSLTETFDLLTTGTNDTFSTFTPFGGVDHLCLYAFGRGSGTGFPDPFRWRRGDPGGRDTSRAQVSGSSERKDNGGFTV
jgi:hypothetical protein